MVVTTQSAPCAVRVILRIVLFRISDTKRSPPVVIAIPAGWKKRAAVGSIVASLAEDARDRRDHPVHVNRRDLSHRVIVRISHEKIRRTIDSDGEWLSKFGDPIRAVGSPEPIH